MSDKNNNSVKLYTYTIGLTFNTNRILKDEDKLTKFVTTALTNTAVDMVMKFNTTVKIPFSFDELFNSDEPYVKVDESNEKWQESKAQN